MKAQPIISRQIFSNKDLVRLMIPLLLEQLLAVTIGTMDAIMVSSVGEAAMSGISLADAINVLLIQIFAALATGGAVVAAQYIGGQREQEASAAAKQLFFVMGAGSLVLGIAGMVFRQGILGAVYGRIDPLVMENARVYFFLTAMSYPAMALYNAGAALFRAMGNSKITMQVSVGMNLINLAGNALLIYVCKLGVAGAGIATLASRIFGAAAMIIMIRDRRRPIYVDRFLHFKMDPQMVLRILKIGVPNGFESATYNLGKLLVAGLVSSFGTAATAANAIGNNIAMLINVPGTSLLLALVPVVGQCVGAGDYEQAKRNINKLMGATWLALLVLDSILVIWARPIAGIFNLSPEALDQGTRILQVFGAGSIFLWLPSFALPTALRAAGDAKFTMAASMISMWAARIGLSYVLGRYLGLGVVGVWAASVLDWAIRSACFLWRYFGGKWRNCKVI